MASAVGTVAKGLATTVGETVGKVREVLTHKDANGSLLQLAEQDADSAEQQFADNSVITQVTSRETTQPSYSARAGNGRGYYATASMGRPPSSDAVPGEDAAPTRPSWRNRFRSLLCCLAPPVNDQYFPHREVPPAIIRPARPVSPSGYHVKTLLGPLKKEDEGRKCLVLDLDETLVHSSFKPVPNPDYIIPVEIEGKVVDVYVLKRPWMDHFLDILGPHYEIVVFTASLSKYADPLLDLLDKSSVVRWRLFRESCRQYEGSYVKDLSCLGRDLRKTIIVDNSPHSYVFQPENAVPIGTFIDDMDEQELLDILPILLDLAKPEIEDVREHIGAHLISLQQQQQRQLQQQQVNTFGTLLTT